MVQVKHIITIENEQRGTGSSWVAFIFHEHEVRKYLFLCPCSLLTYLDQRDASVCLFMPASLWPGSIWTREGKPNITQNADVSSKTHTGHIPV